MTIDQFKYNKQFKYYNFNKLNNKNQFLLKRTYEQLIKEIIKIFCFKVSFSLSLSLSLLIRTNLLSTFHSIKMKIFQTTLKFFEYLGIDSQSRRFNERNLLNISVFGIMVILCCAYLFCEADNLKDYTESIYISSATITALLSFLVFIWRKENIFKFINSWEEVTEKSKQINCRKLCSMEPYE